MLVPRAMKGTKGKREQGYRNRDALVPPDIHYPFPHKILDDIFVQVSPGISGQHVDKLYPHHSPLHVSSVSPT